MTLLHNLILSKIFGGSGGGGGGGSITVDTELSTTSTNPVQNKAIALAGAAFLDGLNSKADKTQERKLSAFNRTLLPENNWFYKFINPMESLVIDLTDITTDSYIFAIRFHSGSTATALTMPSTVKMPDGFEVEANKTYEINVKDGYALVSEWPYTAGGTA